jgi:hypothetical protein
MTNLRGARGGGLLRKESAIWTDSPVMHGHMNSLRRDAQYRPNTLISQPYVPNEFTPNVYTIRCDGSHVHEVVQGQNTKQSENYTMEFAEARCIRTCTSNDINMSMFTLIDAARSYSRSSLAA